MIDLSWFEPVEPPRISVKMSGGLLLKSRHSFQWKYDSLHKRYINQSCDTVATKLTHHNPLSR